MKLYKRVKYRTKNCMDRHVCTDVACRSGWEPRQTPMSQIRGGSLSCNLHWRFCVVGFGNDALLNWLVLWMHILARLIIGGLKTLKTPSLRRLNSRLCLLGFFTYAWRQRQILLLPLATSFLNFYGAVGFVCIYLADYAVDTKITSRLNRLLGYASIILRSTCFRVFSIIW